MSASYPVDRVHRLEAAAFVLAFEHIIPNVITDYRMTRIEKLNDCAIPALAER